MRDEISLKKKRLKKSSSRRLFLTTDGSKFFNQRRRRDGTSSGFMTDEIQLELITTARLPVNSNSNS